MTSPQFHRKARQQHGGPMTPAQFYAVAQLLRIQQPNRDAARLVLVDGQQITDASQSVGLPISRQSVGNTVGRIKRAHAAILLAYTPQRAIDRDGP